MIKYKKVWIPILIIIWLYVAWTIYGTILEKKDIQERPLEACLWSGQCIQGKNISYNEKCAKNEVGETLCGDFILRGRK